MEGNLTDIRQVCLYLTRQCNIRCHYCKIRKDWSNDMTFEQIQDAIKIIKNKIKPELLILFGGEPFLRNDIYEIVQYCNDIGQAYTIISNSTLPVDFDRVKFQSYTGSIDWLEAPKVKGAIEVKSIAGLEKLREAKKHGVPDVSGNIIISSKNFEQVPDLVRKLSSEGIWSVLGIVHSGSENFWKFRSSCDDMVLSREQVNWISDCLFNLKLEGLLIHNCFEYFRMMRMFYNFSWNCASSGLKYLIVDSDGSLMACNDIDKGVMRKFKIFDIENEWEAVKVAWHAEVEDCKGCCYNHMVQVHRSGKLVH